MCWQLVSSYVRYRTTTRAGDRDDAAVVEYDDAVSSDPRIALQASGSELERLDEGRELVGAAVRHAAAVRETEHWSGR